MADVKWIKITTDIFDDEKILLIESLPDSYAIITVWFKLLCLAGKQNNSGVFLMGQMPYTDKMLATIFRMKESTVTMALNTFEQFGMVKTVGGVKTIPNWEKHQNLDKLEQAKEQTRKRVAKHRQKQQLLAECNDDVTLHVTQCNADVTLHVTECNGDRIEEDKEKDKDIEEKKSVRDTQFSLLDRLLPDYIISDTLLEKITEWITYKKERRETYKEQGMKSLLRKIENNSITYGEQAVCDLIDDSMANGWAGIIFDSLKQKNATSQQKGNGRKEIVPNWCTDEYEETVQSYHPVYKKKPKTAAEDESIKARIEAVKRKIAN